MDEIVGERRTNRRYSLTLPLRYRIARSQQPVTSEGLGWTRDISSGGLAFEAASEIALGSAIEVWISWPTATDAVLGLELHVTGTVVRADRRAVALKVERHEFSRR
jgi:hypothetical protein